MEENFEKEYKVVKTTKCMRCGFEHDANFKRCPKCNYSNTLHILSIIAKITSIIALLVFSILNYLSLIKLNEKVDNLGLSTEDSSSATLDISTKAYYSNYLATDDNYENMINGVDNYILYFHQDQCDYCLEANVFVDYYIQLGYMNVTPIIFITPESAPNTFDNFGVESTPTAIYVADGEENKTYVGVDEIYTLFDDIVQNAMNNESGGQQ